MQLSRFTVTMLSAGALALCVTTAFAQDYPYKPVRMLTASPGGGADFVARQLAQGISGPLGQPVVVDNRPNITLGEIVAKAPADGYTLHVNGNSVWIRPLLVKAPYDPINDFAPIALISREPYVLAINPSVPVNSVKELIALARAKPGALNYGSASVAGPSHLSLELFKAMAGGLNIVGVQYKGNAPAVAAVVGGEVQMTIIDAGLVAPQAKAGRLKSLAVTTSEPSALVPGVPTVAASGLPGYEFGSMTGVWSPAKTPEAIIRRLNQEMVRYVARPEVKERFFNAGAEIIGSTSLEFSNFIKNDLARLAKVIKDANIKIE